MLLMNTFPGTCKFRVFTSFGDINHGYRQKHSKDEIINYFKDFLRDGGKSRSGYPCRQVFSVVLRSQAVAIEALEELGFTRLNIVSNGKRKADDLITYYKVISKEKWE